MIFDEGDIVCYDSKEHGKGKGVVVGYQKLNDKILWIIYRKPKSGIPKSLRPKFSCFLAEESELISTPF